MTLFTLEKAYEMLIEMKYTYDYEMLMNINYEMLMMFIEVACPCRSLMPQVVAS